MNASRPAETRVFVGSPKAAWCPQPPSGTAGTATGARGALATLEGFPFGSIAIGGAAVACDYSRVDESLRAITQECGRDGCPADRLAQKAMGDRATNIYC